MNNSTENSLAALTIALLCLGAGWTVYTQIQQGTGVWGVVGTLVVLLVLVAVAQSIRRDE